MAFKEGDLVSRKSYNGDILFKIMKITGNQAFLKGVDYRLWADAPLKDLILPTGEKIQAYRAAVKKLESSCMKNIFQRRSRERKTRWKGSSNDAIEIPGKVLHLDGDKEYLGECLKAYATLGIPARGEYIMEKDQPGAVADLLEEHRPDLLVLTGHDAYMKKGKDDFRDINRYRNSRFFLAGVMEARRYEPAKDDLVIFAGGCQSFYEALMDAGANFASSPQRVLIHCLDPVFVLEKVCLTTIKRSVKVKDAVESSITGLEGLGGIETRGKFRLGLPKSPY